MIDRELQQYYEEGFNTFASVGWTYFMEDMEELLKAVNDIDSVETPETLWFRKGQIDILKLVLERKTAFENAWKDLNGA